MTGTVVEVVDRDVDVDVAVEVVVDVEESAGGPPTAPAGGSTGAEPPSPGTGCSGAPAAGGVEDDDVGETLATMSSWISSSAPWSTGRQEGWWL